LTKDKHEPRRFLGLCTYYWKIVTGFTGIVKKVIQLTEETQTFQWSPGAEATFRPVKSLCMAPVLGYPQPGEKFISIWM
jgi:hypothetical protein